MSWTTMVPSHPLSTLPSLLNMPTMPVMQSLPMSNPLDMSTPLSKSRPAPSRLAMHCFPDFLLHQLAILKVTEKLLSLFFWKNQFISVMNTTCNPFQDHKAQNWGKHLKPVLVVSLNFEKILYIRYIFLYVKLWYILLCYYICFCKHGCRLGGKARATPSIEFGAEWTFHIYLSFHGSSTER